MSGCENNTALKWINWSRKWIGNAIIQVPANHYGIEIHHRAKKKKEKHMNAHN